MVGLIQRTYPYLPLPLFIIHEKQTLALKTVFSSAILFRETVWWFVKKLKIEDHMTQSS